MNEAEREKREERKRWKAVAEFVAQVEAYIRCMDDEMRKSSDLERGKRIAGLTNSLEMGKDTLKHFTLGMDLSKPASRQLNPKRKVTP